MIDINNFDAIEIGLASSKKIRGWSSGEVTKPETINYRTLKPEKDGLFCERIFGPTKDWECYCGKYKRVRYKGIVCERCGVEVTRSKVRRERMGHVDLAAPVSHIWFFKGVPSRIGYLLDMAPKELEKVLYFAASMITWVDDEARAADLESLGGQVNDKKLDDDERTKLLKDNRKMLESDIADTEAYIEDAAERMRQVWETFQSMTPKDVVNDETLFRELKERFGSPYGFGEYFRGGMGAEAVRDLLEQVDLTAEREELEDQVKTAKGQKQQRAVKRLKVVSAFINSGNRPDMMVLEAVPVIPPELRPMVQLDGGRFATSDLNDLYRRVINRNNRLKRLLDLGAPEIIVNNEKRMLQEAVDALFDNGRRGRPVTGPGNRPLKSLSDMLKGKQGRFRQNLLGKRVDYSGRSVIVVGPRLKLHQCGLPKQMALELFKPFVMKRLVDLSYAQNIKSAKRMVERSRPQVWDVLEEVIREHPVLLNRAPTLHRLGIQAFEPVLVEGKAIQIHPLVCKAFNADFDGDQMAVHVPLSSEAQAEARVLMLSVNNILSPANGRPIAIPTHEMVLGIYFLTYKDPQPKVTGRGKKNSDRNPLRVFGSVAEAVMAYDFKSIGLQDAIVVRLPEGKAAVAEDGATKVETTVGRLLFNEALPEDFPYINETLQSRELTNLVSRVADRYDQTETAEVLNKLKTLGFHWASRAGVTVSIQDVLKPPRKQQILDEFEKRAEKVESQFRRGIITDDERRQELIEIWTEATERVREDMEDRFRQEPFNPIYMMATSGARGNMTQVRQIAGMRGLVANPKGDIIPRPIKANFREGLSVLEYFISTHGARKGLADTALRTADSGYLTRRLVDVTQDVIVRESDCGTERGIPVTMAVQRPIPGGKKGEFEWVRPRAVESQALSRILAETVMDPAGKGKQVLVEAGTEIGEEVIDLLVEHGVDEVLCRSVLTCDSKVGVCQMCYGRSLANNRLVDIGEAVGIIAAQSIGEPGTQLTMRTFHTGGIAGEDITHGLPRVQELFEARTPKGMTPIAEFSGRVGIEHVEKGVQVTVTSDEGEEWVAIGPRRARLRVEDGQEVDVGQPIIDGIPNPKEMLRVLGIRATQRHLVEQVQQVYTSQGVTIHDKHIELIVRQMLKRVTVLEGGDTELLPGELIERATFERANREALEAGNTPANGRPELLGITKASRATESWLSAASFQETTRVLTEAAIEGKSDSLIGLKENVIIGKLIPAGTGMVRYRSVTPVLSEIPAAAYGVDAFGDAYETYSDDVYYAEDGTAYQVPVGTDVGTDAEGNGELVDVDAGAYTTDDYQTFEDQQQQPQQ